MKNARVKKDKDSHENLKKDADQQTCYSLSLSIGKGTPSWLNARPLKNYNFCVPKFEFRDGSDLHYRKELKTGLNSCPCGDQFSLTYALHCTKGGFNHIKHNEISDIPSSASSMICPMTLGASQRSSRDEAQLDIIRNGLLGTRFCETFLDVKFPIAMPVSVPKYSRRLLL